MNNKSFPFVVGATFCVLVLSVSQVSFGQNYWWQDPILKYVEIMPDEAHGTSPHYWTFGGPDTTDSTLDQTYLYTQDSGMNANFSQYVVEELRSAEGAEGVEPRWFVQHIGRPKGCSQFGERVVVGNGGEENTPFTSYPDDFTIGDEFEALLEADISPDCDTMNFNHDGTLLYTDHYNSSTGNRNWLHRYQVTGPLDEDGVVFTRDDSWQDNGTFTVSINRLRNFTVNYIGGRDLIYYGEGDSGSGSSSVYVLDPEQGTETQLIDQVFAPGEVEDADIVNVKIAGIASDDLHLYVMGNIAGLKVYKLSDDGLSLDSSEPVKVFTTDDLNTIMNTDAFSSHCRAFLPTDDQQYAFFSAHNANDSIFVVTLNPESAILDWQIQ